MTSQSSKVPIWGKAVCATQRLVPHHRATQNVNARSIEGVYLVLQYRDRLTTVPAMSMPEHISNRFQQQCNTVVTASVIMVGDVSK